MYSEAMLDVQKRTKSPLQVDDRVLVGWRNVRFHVNKSTAIALCSQVKRYKIKRCASGESDQDQLWDELLDESLFDLLS